MGLEHATGGLLAEESTVLYLQEASKGIGQYDMAAEDWRRKSRNRPLGPWGWRMSRERGRIFLSNKSVQFPRSLDEAAPKRWK